MGVVGKSGKDAVAIGSGAGSDRGGLPCGGRGR